MLPLFHYHLYKLNPSVTLQTEHFPNMLVGFSVLKSLGNLTLEMAWKCSTIMGTFSEPCLCNLLLSIVIIT